MIEHECAGKTIGRDETLIYSWGKTGAVKGVGFLKVSTLGHDSSSVKASHVSEEIRGDLWGSGNELANYQIIRYHGVATCLKLGISNTWTGSNPMKLLSTRYESKIDRSVNV